ncbi:ribonuclease Z [Alkanindiges sp. WGS2144]|uniref:ribonuclease Z n=1 Tax=Alkanindiges sp. WGS2144 TaxID=3366808 RepID=UPI003753D3FB
MLTFTFLGTSAGVPTKTRNVSGLVIQNSLNRQWVLIDAGEATQHQLQKVGLSLQQLACICITHVHGDHCYGLPGVLASAGMNRRTQPLTLIAPKQVLDWLNCTLNSGGLYLPYELVMLDSTALLANRWQLFEGLVIQTYPLLHRVPCFAYQLTIQQQQRHLDTQKLENIGLPAGRSWRALQYGQNVEFNGQTLYSQDFVSLQTLQQRAVIAGDNAEPFILAQACEQADVLIHEATYLQTTLDKVGPAYMHSAAQQVAQFAQFINLPNLILTHFSPRHQGDAGQAAMAQEVSRYYQGKFYLARDFDHFKLDAVGQLQLGQITS